MPASDHQEVNAPPLTVEPVNDKASDRRKVDDEAADRRKVDWNLYREQFPARYWEEGEFDERLEQFFGQVGKVSTALDIGGGVLGTRALKDFALRRQLVCDLLDPYVAALAPHFKAARNWGDVGPREYDVICARGSINYLSVEELRKVRAMMSPGGCFVANTFLNAPSTELVRRKAINAQGLVGFEESQLIDKVVHHRVVFGEGLPEGQGYDVSHTFFFHPLETYQAIFPNLQVTTYGKNSAMLVAWNI